MAIITGGGEYVYEVVENWGKLPDGWNYDVAGVESIQESHLLFSIAAASGQMTTVDVDGKVLHSWAIRKRSPTRTPLRWGPMALSGSPTPSIIRSGNAPSRARILMTIGTPGKPAKPMSGNPFYQCTHVAIHPNTGELFISDGDGNAKVHKYTPDGRRLDRGPNPETNPDNFIFRTTLPPIATATFM